MQFFESLWQLSVAMAPYLLFGLLFAGLLHEVIPSTLVTKHLGASDVKSVVKSTIFGIPLPVCSCGVVPLAASINKSGASKGATLSFLISTPITGIDSLLATYSIFGWIFTLYRALTSMLIAIIAGILTNIFDKEPLVKEIKKSSFSIQNPQTDTSCNTGVSSCCSTTKPTKKHFSFTAAFRYAFGTLFSDISKALFWGLIMGALISVAIPQNLSEILTEYAWLSYLIVIIIAVPMYVCATASLPIATGLMLSGVSAGAAFVFLSAGPATNTVTIAVVKKMLGTKSLFIYLTSIILGSLLFGIGLDYLFERIEVDPTSLLHLHEEASLFSAAMAIVLWAMLLWFMLKPSLAKS